MSPFPKWPAPELRKRDVRLLHRRRIGAKGDQPSQFLWVSLAPVLSANKTARGRPFDSVDTIGRAPFDSLQHLLSSLKRPEKAQTGYRYIQTPIRGGKAGYKICPQEFLVALRPIDRDI